MKQLDAVSDGQSLCLGKAAGLKELAKVSFQFAAVGGGDELRVGRRRLSVMPQVFAKAERVESDFQRAPAHGGGEFAA